MADEFWVCPKCKSASGDDWSGCNKACPLEMSPHYQAATAARFGNPIPYKTPSKVIQS